MLTSELFISLKVCTTTSKIPFLSLYRRFIQMSRKKQFLDRYRPYGAWEVEGLFFYTDTAPTGLKKVEIVSFERSPLGTLYG